MAGYKEAKAENYFEPNTVKVHVSIDQSKLKGTSADRTLQEEEHNRNFQASADAVYKQAYETAFNDIAKRPALLSQSNESPEARAMRVGQEAHAAGIRAANSARDQFVKSAKEKYVTNATLNPVFNPPKATASTLSSEDLLLKIKAASNEAAPSISKNVVTHNQDVRIENYFQPNSVKVSVPIDQAALTGTSANRKRQEEEHAQNFQASADAVYKQAYEKAFLEITGKPALLSKSTLSREEQSAQVGQEAHAAGLKAANDARDQFVKSAKEKYVTNAALNPVFNPPKADDNATLSSSDLLLRLNAGGNRNRFFAGTATTGAKAPELPLSDKTPPPPLPTVSAQKPPTEPPPLLSKVIGVQTEVAKQEDEEKARRAEIEAQNAKAPPLLSQIAKRNR